MKQNKERAGASAKTTRLQDMALGAIMCIVASFFFWTAFVKLMVG